MKINNLKLRKGIFTLGMFVLAGSMIGCAKKCEYSDTEHTHEYTMELDGEGNTVSRYSSLENLKGWDKTENVIFEDNNNELDENKNYSLFTIKDNLDILLKYEEENSNFYEYEYEYTDKEISHYRNPYTGANTNSSISSRTKMVNGKVKIETVICTPVYEDVVKTDWTRNNEGNMTGEQRLVTAKYRGVMLDEKGKPAYSDWVDSIQDIDPSFEYFDLENCVSYNYENVLESTMSR